MRHDELTVTDPDGLVSVVQRWSPDHAPRSVVHVLHGWGEHARRYERLATALVGAGHVVVADDHRGHGLSGQRGDSLGDLGPRGMDGVLDAAHAVTRRVAADHPGVPVVALGHSWGSFILQRFLRRWSDELHAAVLTGTTYRDPSAPAERPLPNAAFEPARTPYDWLSRDDEEVDRYVADPLCGFEIMRGSPTAAPSGRTTAPPPGVRPGLPLLILNGAADPIGGEEGGRALAAHYRDEGIADVTLRAYPGARHELFNETNRAEVTSDLLAWIDARI